jgi:hypothetical protein
MKTEEKNINRGFKRLDVSQKVVSGRTPFNRDIGKNKIVEGFNVRMEKRWNLGSTGPHLIFHHSNLTIVSEVTHYSNTPLFHHSKGGIHDSQTHSHCR